VVSQGQRIVEAAPEGQLTYAGDGEAQPVDCWKQTVGTFPLFVHDGTRRGPSPDAPPGMLQNLVTMETFSVRGGLIHHVEAAPFVTLPYGLGNGWTPDSGR
jgi:hypothetical protein